MSTLVKTVHDRAGVELAIDHILQMSSKPHVMPAELYQGSSIRTFLLKAGSGELERCLLLADVEESWRER